MNDTFLMGMYHNDTIQLPPNRPDLMLLGPKHQFAIPPGETWTLEGLSYLFYVDAPPTCRQINTAELVTAGMDVTEALAAAQTRPACDPQAAMVHLIAQKDNYDCNLWTRFAASEQGLAGGANDGLWWGYRNEILHLSLDGPITVRVVAFNANAHPCWIYVAGAWTRRATL